jgi:mannose-1-phosphate guanylyltransferase
LSGGGDAETVRRITPVILCGGSGARLWPLSRKARPKQMLPLFEGRTMLQLTTERIADRNLFNAPVVVTAAAQADDAAAQVGADAMLIVEPCGRSTAPALALAALAADPDTLLLVMPSDHLIADSTRFRECVRSAIAAAEQGMLVTFGVRPTRPETGFGYIRRGEALGNGLFRAARFIEKPHAVGAAALLAEGGYDWNAGIFLFRADAYLAALAEHAPDILKQVEIAVETPAMEARFAPSATAFAQVRAESIDRAVMERASNVAVIPIDVGWSDVGSWEALYAASPRDEAGNCLSGPVEALAAAGCLIRSEGPQVVAIGVENLAIIATGDAILIVPLDQSQRVGEAVTRLATGAPSLV